MTVGRSAAPPGGVSVLPVAVPAGPDGIPLAKAGAAPVVVPLFVEQEASSRQQVTTAAMVSRGVFMVAWPRISRAGPSEESDGPAGPSGVSR